jgi:hypothetical protein
VRERDRRRSRAETESLPVVKPHKGGRKVTIVDLTETAEGKASRESSSSPTLEGLDTAARSPSGMHPIHRGAIQGHWTRRRR